MSARYVTGMDRLISERREVLRGRRVGLVAHPASLNGRGIHSAQLLQEAEGCTLSALFSPEHGYFGEAGAGVRVEGELHPHWRIPVYSLYGESRRPTAGMLGEIDVMLVDLQDLSIRCYTYISTLIEVMEACEGAGVPVVVADRATPWMHCVDGPDLETGFDSFVGRFPGPMVYGLTPGEAATYLVEEHGLRVDLTVIPAGLEGRRFAPPMWQWAPPSPALRHGHATLTYPMLVAFEAFAGFDVGRGGLLPFEGVTSEGIDGAGWAARLNEENLRGVMFHPLWLTREGRRLSGIRISVLDPEGCRPVETAVAILEGARELLGGDGLWKDSGFDERHFDRLFGTDQVRMELQRGGSWRDVVEGWDVSAYQVRREPRLLYG
ncbi:MAG TPA: DUF1343 domain-containing protein [Kiritimatiellia bacterium]|nr:DUF1343 domain-containing protein [Kiritimatiellia bacterium]